MGGGETWLKSVPLKDTADRRRRWETEGLAKGRVGGKGAGKNAKKGKADEKCYHGNEKGEGNVKPGCYRVKVTRLWE